MLDVNLAQQQALSSMLLIITGSIDAARDVPLAQPDEPPALKHAPHNGAPVAPSVQLVTGRSLTL